MKSLVCTLLATALLATLAGCSGFGDPEYHDRTDQPLIAAGCLPAVSSADLREGTHTPSHVVVYTDWVEMADTGNSLTYDVEGRTIADDTGDMITYEWLCRIEIAEDRRSSTATLLSFERAEG